MTGVRVRRGRTTSLLAALALAGAVGAGCSDDTGEPAPADAGQPAADGPCILACSHHGSCELRDGEQTCLCDPGYAGERCGSCADGYQQEANGACVVTTVSTLCSDTCALANDGTCDEIGTDRRCELGTDCSDCGPVRRLCSDTCSYANNGICMAWDDTGNYLECPPGEDCSDCGPVYIGPETCPQPSGTAEGTSGAAPPPGCEGALPLTSLVARKVRESLGLEDGGAICWQRASNLRTLSELSYCELGNAGWADCYNPGSLAGVQCLTGLESIRSDGDPEEGFISALPPLAGLTSLTSLRLSHNAISDLSPLAEVTSLIWLNLSHNAISDISPLAGLTSLDELSLYGNEVTDLSPLVANAGIGDGDVVELGGNPIDCTDQAANLQALQDRGAYVLSDCL